MGGPESSDGIAGSPARTLRVCGELTLDGRPVEVAGRLQVLLVVLAAHGPRGIARGELAELLWPDVPPTDLGAALDPLISRLRRIAGPVTARGTVRLDGVRIDLHEALDVVRAARGEGSVDAAEILAAARVLAHEIAPGCDHPWVGRQRLALRDTAAGACELAADRATRPQDALDAARLLVALRPLEERPVALLMDTLGREGDRAAALVAYEQARGRLRDGLGVAPGPLLRDRHAVLLGADRPGPRLPAPPLPEHLAAAADAPLAGRGSELAWIEAAARPGRVVLLEGPPGIGKTRLAAALAARRHAGGAAVLLARGSTLAAGPFAALSGALGALLATAGVRALRDAAGPLAGDLARLLPPLGEGVAVAADPDTARLRLVDAIAALLHAAAEGRGLLLVVDDLHVLDASSAQVVEQLVAAATVRGMTVVATARPGSEQAAGLLAAAGRERASTLSLTTLDADGLLELVRTTRPELADGAAATLAARLERSTGGTPLLARAALRGRLAAADGSEPAAPDADSDLDAAVAAMAAWAGEDATALLRLAALDDTPMPLAVLAAAAGIELPRAATAIDRAREAGLLAAGNAVVHASVRDALVRNLGEAAREDLHARLATALEEADGAPGAIAALWGRAGAGAARASAARWEETAAERALTARAHEDAAEHAARALAHVRAGAGDPARETVLLALLGRAYNAAGRLAAGREALREGQRRAREAGDRALVAQIAADAAGHRLGAGFVDAELAALVEEGLAATAGDALGGADAADRAGGAGGAGAPILRARLAARMATLLLGGPLERRDALLAEADALARRSGDPGTLAEALIARHICDVHLARPDDRTALTSEITSLAIVAGRPELRLHARMLRFSDRLEAGDLSAARAEMVVWQEEAERDRVPYHRWAAAVCAPTLDLLDGRADLARASLVASVALAVPLGDDDVVRSAIVAQEMSIGLAEGRPEETTRAIGAGVVAAMAEAGATPAWVSVLAWCDALRGDAAAARVHLDGVDLATLEDLVEPNRATALAFLSEAATAAGASDALLAALDSALARHDGTLVVQQYGGNVHGPVAARRARLAAARGDAPAAAHHAAAAAALAGLDAPPVLAIDVLRARAAALHAQGDAKGAAAARDEAAGLARAHGLLGLAAAAMLPPRAA